MTAFFSLLKAFITRAAFCLHVIVSVVLVVVHTKQSLYWLFLIGILFMILEMLYIMIKRKGREYRLFWPSCFLYLSAIIPVIWILELDLLQHRLNERDQLNKLNDSKEIILTRSIGKYKFSASIDADVVARKVCLLGVLLFIILGRWLLPRGKLTRDQLSNLLLAYIGLGADILDLFEPLGHPNVKYNTALTYTTLVLFTWSMLQFCLIAMATAGSDDVSEATSQQNTENTRKASCAETGRSSKTGAKKPPSCTGSTSSVTYSEDDLGDDESAASSANSNRNQHEATQTDDPQTTPKCFSISADLVAIISSLVMHDGPLLIFRLFLLGMYNVASEIHLFFTAKNALTVAIMLYRLYHLAHVPKVAPTGPVDHKSSKGCSSVTPVPKYNTFLEPV